MASFLAQWKSDYLPQSTSAGEDYKRRFERAHAAVRGRERKEKEVYIMLRGVD